jgi:hypothetical protein
VPQEFAVGAAGVFEGVGQDREAAGVEGAGGQFPLLVGGLGERHHLGRLPRGGDGGGAEGVTDDVA